MSCSVLRILMFEKVWRKEQTKKWIDVFVGFTKTWFLGFTAKLFGLEAKLLNLRFMKNIVFWLTQTTLFGLHNNQIMTLKSTFDRKQPKPSIIIYLHAKLLLIYYPTTLDLSLTRHKDRQGANLLRETRPSGYLKILRLIKKEPKVWSS